MSRLPDDIGAERPLTVADLEAVNGAAWTNATGVIATSLHVEDGQFITQDVMPGHVVQQIIDDVAQHTPRPGTHLAGRLPLPLFQSWHREWRFTAKLWGIPWQTFFARKFFDSDYNKFRVRK
jgi:hypothetical protein